MSDIGAANIRITGSSTGFVNALKDAGKQANLFVSQANSNLSRSFRDADAQQRVFRGGLTRLGNELQDVAKKYATFVSLPALFAAGKTFKDFAEIEKLEKGLVRFGESLKGVREIAKLPNIGIFDGAKSLISLKAMKISSDLATRSIKAFANAITEAGGSSIDLEPALINLRQFAATKHINQVDVRQLAARLPQTYDAFQSAFGTQDVEKLNAELKKLGTEAFIGKFIAELEKIPPAGAGAATAMEQLGDSATFFSATIGKGLENTFKITDKFKALGGTLDQLSSNFAALDPNMQKVVITLAGFAVALPAIVAGVGGLIKLLPLISTGFTGWGGVVVGVVTALAALGAIIPVLSNSTAEFFSESEKFTQLAPKLGGLITQYESLAGKAKLSGAEQRQLRQVTKDLGDAVPWATTKFDEYGKALEVNTHKVREFIGEQKELLEQLRKTQRQETLSDIQSARNRIGGINNQISEGVTYEANSSGAHVKRRLSNNEIGQLRNDAAALNEELNKSLHTLATIEGIGTISERRERRGGLGTVKPQNPNDPNSDPAGYDILSEKSTKYQKLLKNEKEELADKLRLLEEIKRIGSGLNQVDANGISSGFAVNAFSQDPENQRFQQANASNKANNVFSKLGDTSITKGLEDVNKKLATTSETTKGLVVDLSASLQDAALDAGVAFGELIGNLMSGAGGVENFGRRVLGSLANMLKEMGKSLIAAGTAGLALKVFAKNPALALVAGVGLVALGTATANKLQNQADSGLRKFAEGAEVRRQMVAVIGDNKNARHDPEIVAPYSKIDQSINKSIQKAGGSGGQVLIPEIRIEGSDLVIALTRAQDRNFNLRGF